MDLAQFDPYCCLISYQGLDQFIEECDDELISFMIEKDAQPDSRKLHEKRYLRW